MKLLNYTTSHLAVILIFLLAAWAVVFYFEILDEIYDSMDDGLDNQKMLIIRKVREEPELLRKSKFEDGNYIISPTSASLSRNFTDSYRDTLMFMENESEYEPVRLLESVFRQDGNYYKIKVVTSMVEEDDLRKELFFSLLWLYGGLILSILLLNRYFQIRTWKPFYKLLQHLEKFNIVQDKNIEKEETKIDEFRLLNQRVDHLVKKSVESYQSQKEFIENASHELQTPLAISINKLELMAENPELPEEAIEELAVLLSSLERLARLNRSLLLLSRIENRQFELLEEINWNQQIKQLIKEFKDLASHREVKLNFQEETMLISRGNRDLAGILVSNLLRNALVHSARGSEINIFMGKNEISFENTGEKALNKQRIFNRFKGAQTENSTGLGLAISKAIADKFDISLMYKFKEGKHIFLLKF